MSSFKRAAPAGSAAAVKPPALPTGPASSTTAGRVDGGAVATSATTTASVAAPASTTTSTALSAIIPGTRKWLDGSLLLSSGPAQLDAMLGGGLQAGTLVLLEEDVGGIHARTLAQLFAAEGVACGHRVIVAGHDGRASAAEFLSSLPMNVSRDSRDLAAVAVGGAGVAGGSEASSGTAQPSETPDGPSDPTGAGLKNAWQYKRYLASQPAGYVPGQAQGQTQAEAKSGAGAPAAPAAASVDARSGHTAAASAGAAAPGAAASAASSSTPLPLPLPSTSSKYCHTFDLGRRIPLPSLQAAGAGAGTIILPTVQEPPVLVGLPHAGNGSGGKGSGGRAGGSTSGIASGILKKPGSAVMVSAPVPAGPAAPEPPLPLIQAVQELQAGPAVVGANGAGAGNGMGAGMGVGGAMLPSAAAVLAGDSVAATLAGLRHRAIRLAVSQAVAAVNAAPLVLPGNTITATGGGGAGGAGSSALGSARRASIGTASPAAVSVGSATAASALPPSSPGIAAGGSGSAGPRRASITPSPTPVTAVAAGTPPAAPASGGIASPPGKGGGSRAATPTSSVASAAAPSQAAAAASASSATVGSGGSASVYSSLADRLIGYLLPRPGTAAGSSAATAGPTRVVLLGLGGPHWPGFTGSDAAPGLAGWPLAGGGGMGMGMGTGGMDGATSEAVHTAHRPLLTFLARLRRMLEECSVPGTGQPGAVAVVTIPTWCMPLAVAEHARMHAHVVLKLHAFGEPAYALATAAAPRVSAAASTGTAPEFASYTGLLLVRRTGRPGAVLGHLPDTLTWIFKRDRRKMVVEQPHLPPEGEGGPTAAASGGGGMAVVSAGGSTAQVSVQPAAQPQGQAAGRASYPTVVAAAAAAHVGSGTGKGQAGGAGAGGTASLLAAPYGGPEDAWGIAPGSGGSSAEEGACCGGHGHSHGSGSGSGSCGCASSGGHICSPAAPAAPGAGLVQLHRPADRPAGSARAASGLGAGVVASPLTGGSGPASPAQLLAEVGAAGRVGGGSGSAPSTSTGRQVQQQQAPLTTSYDYDEEPTEVIIAAGGAGVPLPVRTAGGAVGAAGPQGGGLGGAAALAGVAGAIALAAPLPPGAPRPGVLPTGGGAGMGCASAGGKGNPLDF